MSIRNIKVDVVQLCSGTQMREVIDGALIETYTEDIKRGDEFPPVDLFYDGKEYWLADGFHRFIATRDSGAKTINAIVHRGTLRDAVLFAVGANAAHGLRRTNADKRKAVATLLDDKEWSGWSNVIIAKKCGVSSSTVDNHRNQLPKLGGSPGRTKGKDGKKRRRPKKKALPDADSFPGPEDDAPDDVQPPATSKPTPAVSAKISSNLMANMAAREILQTVEPFLRLNPAVEDVEPLLNALAEAQTLVESYMAEGGADD